MYIIEQHENRPIPSGNLESTECLSKGQSIDTKRFPPSKIDQDICSWSWSIFEGGNPEHQKWLNRCMKKIRHNPRRSMRKLPKEVGILEWTMW